MYPIIQVNGEAVKRQPESIPDARQSESHLLRHISCGVRAKLEGPAHAVEQQFEGRNSSTDDSVIPTQTGKRLQSALEIKHKVNIKT
jgi:hypothetical protein